MAVNKATGDNARKGAVKKRTQLQTRTMGKKTWTKRDKDDRRVHGPEESAGQEENQRRPPRALIRKRCLSQQQFMTATIRQPKLDEPAKYGLSDDCDWVCEAHPARPWEGDRMRLRGEQVRLALGAIHPTPRSRPCSPPALNRAYSPLAE
jgi:hypothetical protein